jgi:ParB family chromosome partitioning protein
MKRNVPKLSGLIRSGAVVPSVSPHATPDDAMPESIPARLPAELTEGDHPHNNLRMIDVALIDPNPLAPREVYTPDMVLDRAEALRNQGQHDPIHVIPHPDYPGRFIIVDGWTRVLACVVHKVSSSLMSEIHTTLTLEEAAWYGYEQNEERQQHCDLDRAFFYEKMIARGESAAEIARRAKLTKPMLTYYRAYTKLPDDVLEIIRGNPTKFGSLVAYNLLKLNEKCGLRKTVSLANKYADEDHPVRWLVNQVQAYINPGEHKATPPLKHVRYGNGFYKQRGDGFEISIQVAPEKRESFALALEALLDTVAQQEHQGPQQSLLDGGGE